MTHHFQESYDSTNGLWFTLGKFNTHTRQCQYFFANFIIYFYLRLFKSVLNTRGCWRLIPN
ncbi:hypothetical protein CJI56_06240 [Gardnerella vaginalis]|nr:hypothetical protein CYJ68_02415 [Gardnerella vaginalis]RIY19099.1 hypothetical protein CJI56_06240 [Gardnerella vaginalis]